MSEPATGDRSIGVGMGGSCPECRAPVDLGQEFCLECGAPIRIRRQQRSGTRSAAGGATAARSARVAPMQPDGRVGRGFPWIPFLAILGLVTLGVVFVLAEHGSKPAKSARKGGSVADDLTTGTGSTNTSAFPSVQTDTTTTSTDPNCATGANSTGAGGSGAVVPPTTNSSTPGIATTADGFLTTAKPATGGNPGGPSAGAGGADAAAAANGTGGAATTTPTTPSAGGAGCSTSTTPQATTPTTSSPTTPTTTGPTSPTTTTSTTATTATDTTATSATSSGGAWPAGKHGWTIVLASFAKDRYSRSDAEARSVEAQQKGVSSGVLDSDGFKDLRTSLWVVFSGVYDSQAAADAHVSEVGAKGYQGAYVREITPA